VSGLSVYGLPASPLLWQWSGTDWAASGSGAMFDNGRDVDNRGKSLQSDKLCRQCRAGGRADR